MSPLLTQSFFAFTMSITMTALLARMAPFLGLIDSPSSRKRHVDSVPVVGGLALLATLCAAALVWGQQASPMISINGRDAVWVFLGCAAFLTISGALDDRFQLGVFPRIFSELLVALVVIELLNLRVANLGDLFGFGHIRLNPLFAYPFTAIAIFGVINAFNMLDGMDGVLATTVLTTLIAFHLFIEIPPGIITITIFASLLAFLVSNLSLMPGMPKTFLGDSGSRLLGFVVVCLLLAATSEQVGGTKLIKPATALFLIALPLFDMVFTTIRRVVRKGSPFEADRTHIHHLLSDLGFSDKRALVVIVSISCCLNFIGLMLHRSGADEFYQIGIFFICFGLYCLLLSQAWLIPRQLRAEHLASVIDKEA